MGAKLIIAMLAPWVSGVALGIPPWLIMVSGITPWAAADWLARNTDAFSIKQAYTVVLIIETLSCILAIWWLIDRKRCTRVEWSKRGWLFAVLTPAALIWIGLTMRGTLVEFPTDSFQYYHSNLTQEQLSSKIAPGLAYNSAMNWYYSSQYYLWNLKDNLSINTAGGIAGLNSFVAILASANLVWQLTKRWELAWLSCLLFLIGFGHQSLSFMHQLSLNGTLIGIALIMSATVPLLESVNAETINIRKLLGYSTLVTILGGLAFKAHAVSGYFTLNILTATWLSACVAINQSRIIRAITAGATTTMLAILNKKDYDPNLKLVSEYPEFMRIVHARSVYGNTIRWFWPALPNSTLEITLIGSTILALINLWVKSKGISAVANSTVALSALPFIIYAEWLVPGINDLTFKLISPEVAYRIAWTSLFWVSIPVMAMEISKALASKQSQIDQWLKGVILAVVGLLAIPVHLGTESNILNSKVPHLLSPLESASVVDGSSVEPILRQLDLICNQKKTLQQGSLLSDPFVGAVLRRARCAYPLAGLDYGKNSVESAEKGFYDGLSQSISNEQNLMQWLTDRRINIIVLRSEYPVYYSEIGMNSRHWQPDLVSGYRNLTLNQLNEALLKKVGFSKQLQQNNLLVFTRNL